MLAQSEMKQKFEMKSITIFGQLDKVESGQIYSATTQPKKTRQLLETSPAALVAGVGATKPLLASLCSFIANPLQHLERQLDNPFHYIGRALDNAGAWAAAAANTPKQLQDCTGAVEGQGGMLLGAHFVAKCQGSHI